ncbi:MAG: LacI family transcriptional regulator [Candidatus Azotimanducaceae bacterium]|jgi:LacI family transcriptional regulator
MKKIRISQQQIARDLGVSQTLVSMVLNGRRSGVSEKSYDKIWGHARKMGYRPKGIDTELMASPVTTKSVGFLLRTGATLYNQSPFFGHLQHGLHTYLTQKNISLLFLGTEDDLEVQNLENLGNPNNFLGLVVMGEVSRSFLQAICKLDSRVVTISCQYSGLCNSVLPNEEQAAELLVQHLMEHGHKHFAWVGGNRNTQRANSRLKAIQSALHLRDASIDPKFCIESESGDHRDGSQIAEALLEAAGSDPIPTAWISFNGVMARGAISLLRRKGLSVPSDISVAAFDGTRVCEDEHPTLTAAATSPELMGRVAAELLLDLKDAEDNRFSDLILSAELNERESTAAVPASSQVI